MIPKDKEAIEVLHDAFEKHKCSRNPRTVRTSKPKTAKAKREDINQAAFRVMRESTEKT